MAIVTLLFPHTAKDSCAQDLKKDWSVLETVNVLKGSANAILVLLHLIVVGLVEKLLGWEKQTDTNTMYINNKKRYRLTVK